MEHVHPTHTGVTIAPSGVQDKKCFIHTQGDMFKIISKRGNLACNQMSNAQNCKYVYMYLSDEKINSSLCVNRTPVLKSTFIP